MTEQLGHDFSSPGESVSSSQRLGVQFTVGSEDLEISFLEIYSADSGFFENVLLHRNSDGALIAQADIIAALDEWVRADITPVTLSANTGYTISYRYGGLSRDVYKNPAGVTVNSAISLGSSVSSSGNTLPTSTTSDDHLAARVGWIGSSAAEEIDAFISAPSPLSSPSALVDEGGTFVSLPGPLSPPRVFVDNDWTNTVPKTAQIYYYARLRSGFISLELPISSWQATLQSGRSSYLQCVVPSASNYIDQITAISNNAQLTIVRGALFSDGERRELEMATVPLQQLPYQRGSQRETITLSGYGQIAFDVLGIGDNPGLTRNLSGIQTISTQGGTRVRASVDWMLRPGRVAVADGIEFVVSYINYYVNRNQEIMEVGERPL